ncbi:hypothetical protein J690_3233 [Acinetobacter sp. 742879]|nr:hypothetical protein J690_3233 [Acinetobacter sp. 742879]
MLFADFLLIFKSIFINWHDISKNKSNNNFYLSIEEKLIIIFYLTFPLM